MGTSDEFSWTAEQAIAIVATNDLDFASGLRA